MVSAYSTPRLLMNRLRQMMAEGGGVQDRLNRVVRLIAGTMVADVCSIYLRTGDDLLELVATEGLRAEAISTTRLALNEGLVGQIAMTAEPLSIQDAPRHPAFSYRPETGEDPYLAFLGVPVLRGGRVIGVLTVQNRTARVYGEDEVETLETIAMVLAEVVTSGLSAEPGSLSGITSGNRRALSLKGRVLCPGLGVGYVRLHDPIVPAAKFFAEDVGAELSRLTAALKTLRETVDAMVTLDGGALGNDPREVMETYRMMANDPSWAEKLAEGIRGGLTAEASVDKARREHRARLESAKDPYLRERLHDLEDLDNRLLRTLGGDNGAGHGDAQYEPGAVLIARRLGPADLLEYRDAGLAGILLEEAAASSHAAIVARALGIPTLGGIDGLTISVEAGDPVIVDAESGRVHLRPDDALVAAFEARTQLRTEQQAAYRALRDVPSNTKDGTPVTLMLNAGLRLDLDHLTETGAEGVGLFRTEFQFLVSESLPRLNEQQAFYERVFDTAKGRPILFRTLDLGGDKVLPNLNVEREENPALGWRSIRFALDHKGLFKRQLRALVRAAKGRPLSVMFPMITTPEEYFEAKAMLLEEVEWSAERGFAPPAPLKVGAMLETPAFAYVLDEIAGEVDFISVGTNDLMQFFFAADRMTPRVSDRYDLVSRPAMRFLQFVSQTCDRLGIPVSICGEASGDPVDALALIGAGFRRLSMPAAGIGPVKQMIVSLDLAAYTEAFNAAVSRPGTNLRKEVLTLAAQHGINVPKDTATRP